MLNHLEKVFSSFDSHDVRYVVIGGVAAVLHGVPRATFDLDILIDPTAVNARRLLDALADAGLGTAELTTPEDVLANAITVFQDVVRIDVQTRTPGVTFSDAWDRRETMDYRGRKFQVLSRDDVIATKLAAGRDVDLDDVRQLRREDGDEGGRADGA